MINKKHILPILFAIIFTSGLFLPARPALAAHCAAESEECLHPGPPSVPATPAVAPSVPATPAVSAPVLLLNPLKVDTIAELLQLILQIVTIFAVPIIVFFIIYAGFLFVTAQGKPDQITKARNALLWSVIGGVIILGANVLLIVITNTVNALKAP